MTVSPRSTPRKVLSPCRASPEHEASSGLVVFPSIKCIGLHLSRIRPRCLVRAAFLPGPALAAGLGARQRFPKQIFAQCNNTWERAGAFASPAPGGGSRGAGLGLGRGGFNHALTCRCAELPRFQPSLCSMDLHKEAFNLHPSKRASLSAGRRKPCWAPGQGNSGLYWCPALVGLCPAACAEDVQSSCGPQGPQIYPKILLSMKLSNIVRWQHRAVGVGLCISDAGRPSSLVPSATMWPCHTAHPKSPPDPRPCGGNAVLGGGSIYHLVSPVFIS